MGMGCQSMWLTPFHLGSSDLDFIPFYMIFSYSATTYWAHCRVLQPVLGVSDYLIMAFSLSFKSRIFLKTRPCQRYFSTISLLPQGSELQALFITDVQTLS